MARMESEDYVPGESGWSLEHEEEEVEAVEEPEEAPEEEKEPAPGPVYVRGPGGKLLIEDID